ncbi:hypothetical protein GCM10023091_41550 [Ravibacter arvi]|uniref:Outer membrane protein beta-barrel domain-containing protein n=1 Tax=Ravibacter arvi TaxID=2051041 RepID=A0ABP8MAR5_9BACT
MNTEKHPTDRDLQRAFQQKFKDFEATPDPELDKKILGHIGTPRPPAPNKLLVLSGVIILAFLAALLFVENGKETVKPVEAGKNTKLHITPDRHIADEQITGFQGTTNKAHHQEAALGRGTSRNRLPGPLQKSNTQQSEIQVSASEQPGLSNDTGLLTNEKTIQLDVIEKRRPYPSIAVSLNPANLLASDANHAFLTDSANGKPDKTTHHPPSKTAFVVSLAGINTFQKLIVMPNPTARLQNFNVPVSFQNTGFSAHLGIEKKGMSLTAGYSRFQQELSYEIATGAYVLVKDHLGNYAARSEGIPVKERADFNLLGLSLKKQLYFRSPGLRDFYGYLGVSGNIDVQSAGKSGWLSIGGGKNIMVNPNLKLSVAPYAEYSIGRLKSTNAEFRFRPLLVGLSMNLRIAGN